MSNNDGTNPPASDQRQKELSISTAASSMINASDMISGEAYQANLKRIQEVKEMVQRLEVNNEMAHNNYVVDQLEKRAKEGREAEILLARLKNQPGLSETVQFTNNVPSDKSEVILPTTATLVEVPELHPSHSSPSLPTASLPQAIQRNRPAESQWSIPPQVQPYSPNALWHYMPPSTVRQPLQHSSASRSQAMDGQMYTTQNVPSKNWPHVPLVHQTGSQPIQVQQYSQPWSNYPPPVIALQAAGTAAVPGFNTSPSGWIRTELSPSTGSSGSTYREPSYPMQSTTSRPPVTTHNQSQILPSIASVSRVQVPLHGVSAPSAKIPSSQPPSARSHLKPAEARSRPVPTVVSKAEAISELRRHHNPPQQFQNHRQQFQQPPPQHQPLPQLPPQLRQHSQPPQPQPQSLPQPLLQPVHHPQQHQELSSRRPLQPPLTHLQAPPQSAGRMATSVSQLHSQPSRADTVPANASSGILQTQSPHPPVVQEQEWQQGARSCADQATFIRLFQTAVQRGVLHFKVFFLQAKASGISDEWFRAAINSLPRDVWESVVLQVNQSGPTPGAQSSANVSQQQVWTIPGLNVSAVSARPSSIATPLVQTMPAVQQAAKLDAFTEERITLPATGQTSGAYSAPIQYYAEQATKSALSAPIQYYAEHATRSALSAQAANISTTTPRNTPSGQKTSTWEVPQAQVNVRTPKDANKSTLARDILRSLGNVTPKPYQEIGSEAMANNHGGDQLPEVTSTQPVSQMASLKSPVVLPMTNLVQANAPLIPSAKPNVQEHVSSPDLSTANSVLKGEAAVIEGPIMIDLTLEDSDDSADSKGQEPEATFPIQTTNTTNHTPLLENLSLEEPPVDVAAAGDNADVRMYSPLLSLPAEENMESDLSYTPLGSTEPVSPTFEPMPREASEHPPDGQLPLFLPSPPVSLAHTEPPETEPETIDDEGKIPPSLKRRSVGTDEMEIDTEVLAPRVRKRRKQRVYVLVPPAPLYVKKTVKKTRERAIGKDIDSDSEGVGEDEEFQYSHLEQLLIEESKSLLLERRCWWLNCGAILNCAANLLAHLKKHTREENSLAPFLCRWASCQRQFDVEQERDVHLKRHTIRPLPCPFADCDERFNKPVEVMHHEVQHHKAEPRELMRKPTYQPIVPAIPARLGPPPHRLPSHRVIPRRVLKCQISADRHAIMGPWILWNIFSPVDLSTRKQNASMRGRPARPAINYDIDGSDLRRDDYDFLLALSPHPAKSPQLDDLDSTLITMSAARGLTLWGSESASAKSTTPEESTDADAALISAVEEAEIEGRLKKSEVARKDGRPGSGQSVAMGEEDAVERMLIL